MVSNDTTVPFGETALLTCVGYAIPDVAIIWTHNGLTLENSTLVMIVESDILLAGALFRQSVLQICDVGLSESGTYTCIVTNNRIHIDAFIELTVIGKHRGNTIYVTGGEVIHTKVKDSILDFFWSAE